MPKFAYFCRLCRKKMHKILKTQIIFNLYYCCLCVVCVYFAGCVEKNCNRFLKFKLFSAYIIAVYVLCIEIYKKEA